MFTTIIKKHRLNKIKKGWDFFHKENYIKARKKTTGLTSCKDPEINEEANRITGLSAYHQKLYEEAIPYFSKAAPLSNRQHDWYNLAMAHAKANHIDEAENAFMKIYSAKSQHNYKFAISIPTMIYQYMRVLKQMKAHKNAFQRVIELRAMYEAMRRSDEKIMIASGLPSFNHYVKEVVPILKELYSEPEVKDWLKDLTRRMDTERTNNAWR